jgi:hypothetical protein
VKKVKDGTTVNPVLNDSLQKIVEVSSTEATGSIGFVGYISNEDPMEENFTVKFSVVSVIDSIVVVLWESGTVELAAFYSISVSTPFFCLGSVGSTVAILGLYVTRTAGIGAETSCIGTVYNLSDGIDIETINGAPPITADDIADKVFKNPANLLATDKDGRIDLGSVAGTAVSSVDDFKADVSGIVSIVADLTDVKIGIEDTKTVILELGRASLLNNMLKG